MSPVSHPSHLKNGPGPVHGTYSLGRYGRGEGRRIGRRTELSWVGLGALAASSPVTASIRVSLSSSRPDRILHPPQYITYIFPSLCSFLVSEGVCSVGKESVLLVTRPMYYRIHRTYLEACLAQGGCTTHTANSWHNSPPLLCTCGENKCKKNSLSSGGKKEIVPKWEECMLIAWKPPSLFWSGPCDHLTYRISLEFPSSGTLSSNTTLPWL